MHGAVVGSRAEFPRVEAVIANELHNLVSGSGTAANRIVTLGSGWVQRSRVEAGTQIEMWVGGGLQLRLTNSGVWQSSLREMKENITPAQSVLDKIMLPQIFQYNYVEGKTLAQETRTTPTFGFVLGDGFTPPPAEIASDDMVNLYSMTAMLWKATQELAVKVSNLEERVIS
jgi:hypothetical protein